MHDMHAAFMVVTTFALGFLLDIIQVAYTNASVDNRKYIAANLSVLFSGFAAASIIFVVHNPWLMIPYLLGIWFGTIASMDGKE